MPIDHIIVLYEENRTFDSYFGTYPGADGITGNESLPIAKGSNVTVSPFHLSNTSTADLDHSHSAAVKAYDGGKMDGFIYAEKSNMTMGYYDYRDIPYYWNYASKFVLMDNFFSSEMGPSLPNHLYLIAGQSGNLYENTNASELTLNFTIIMDKLESLGVSWKYYYNGPYGYATPGLWNPLPAFESFKTNQSRLNNLAPNSQFLADLNSGNLASVVWVMPIYNESEHPPADVEVGERYIVSLINAIMQSKYWNSTAIFVTWDDYGGWYDHVPPPQLDSFGLGFRVPCLVISPYAKEGFIDHTQADFCSILKFIETKYSLPPLTQRDAATNDMLEAFNFSQLPRAPLIVPWMVLNPYRTILGKNVTTSANVTVQNQGNVDEAFNVTLFYDSNQIGTQPVTLHAQQLTVLHFRWTTPSIPGNYTMKSNASQVLGVTNLTNNVAIFDDITVSVTGDINGDFKVDILDAIALALAFNSKPNSSGWNPNADLNEDGTVNILDAIILAGNYRKTA